MISSLFHVGLAVLFYMLGEEGLEKGSLLAGTLILFNNALAIIILSLSSGRQESLPRIAFSIIRTPIIMATFAAIIFVLMGFGLPAVIMKSLEIVANISLPLALIIIGGSISPAILRKTFRPAVVKTVLKMFFLPGVAFVFYTVRAPDRSEAVPAMVLLATPTAIKPHT